MSGHAAELSRGERFGFGANWRRFLASVDDARIAHAEASLKSMLGVETLRGRRFLDAGCGSGLFSLAAVRLGASVVAFDFDPASVACANELRARFAPPGSDWTLREGSVLDETFLATLGTFDVVYSWGVLHHTGAMWSAIALVAKRVAPSGSLFIALYNDQGRRSRMWLGVKRAYNRMPPPLRFTLVLPCAAFLWGPTFLKETLALHPGRAWSRYAATGRGMSPWRDIVDWVGGLPFEVAPPERVAAALRPSGFTLRRQITQGRGHGCNEFVFVSNPGGEF